MDYMAEHIDSKLFEDALNENRKAERETLNISIERARAYFNGYDKCIEDVRGMLHCKNYESKDQESRAYYCGANAALYELCKELDINSSDIRAMDISIDEKAALIAEKIRQSLGEEDSV